MSDLHIMRIKGNGFLNLKAVDVTMDGGVVKVGGTNRAGKTSLLKLIKLMAGKNEMPELPKTEGTKKGKFEIALGDGEGKTQVIVKYSFTDKNSYVSVEDAEGEKIGLEILKEMLSPCLDPWGFYQNATAEGTGAKTRRAKAVELLKELMVTDYDLEPLLTLLGMTDNTHVRSLLSQHKGDTLGFLTALEASYFETRARWNDKVKTLTGTVATLKKEIPPEDRDAEEVKIEDLFAKQKELQAVQTAHDKYEMEFSSLEDDVHGLEAKLAAAKQAVEEKRAEAAKLPSCDAAELESLEVEIRTVSQKNEVARKAKDLKEREAELEKTEEGAEARTEAIAEIRQARLDAMASASMPIEGLAIEDGNITKNGIPLGQDSHEEGLTDAFMIGLAKFDMMKEDAPKLKTLLLPDASLLGKKATERLVGLAEEHGVQLIMELVMDERTSGVQIFVEDGEAKNT